MKKPLRWTSAAGAVLVVALAGLTPVATANAAPPALARSVAAAHAAVDEPRQGRRPAGPRPGRRGVRGGSTRRLRRPDLRRDEPEELDFLGDHFDTVLDVPTYAPLLYGTSGDPTYALTLHATQLQKTFRQVKGFWDIKSDDIQLMAMHGEVLMDADLIEATNLVLDEGATPPADIRAEAEEVAAYMQAHPAFAGNPLWTLNAYAFSAADEEPGSPYPGSRTSWSSATASSRPSTPSGSATSARAW